MKPLKIALIGDSMTEKWGPAAPQLVAELNRLYVRTEFEIENHGLANTRAGYALYRVTHDYKDAVGNYRPCVSFGDPNLVIIESFAYTNCADDVEGLTEYRDVLRRLHDEIERTTAAKCLFHITIPPDRERFVENLSNFFNTSKATRQRLADRAKLYLEEAQRIAADEEWIVADAYADVLKRVEGGDKLPRYINQSDNLSPSVYGYEAIARVIVRAIDMGRLIEEPSAH
ncbi:MAG TPA: hypothetical protein VF719_09970 [Abditibacteriaceae bacterium]|jgi:hypothetical protein